MPTITVTIDSEPVINATTEWNDPITITDIEPNTNGQYVVDIPPQINDGNVAETVEVNVTNVQNGELVNVAVDNPAQGTFQFFTPAQLPAQVVIPPNGNATIKLYFTATAGAPGEPAFELTADYDIHWV